MRCLTFNKDSLHNFQTTNNDKQVVMGNKIKGQVALIRDATSHLTNEYREII